MERLEIRRLRNEFQKELERHNGQIDSLYAEESNRIMSLLKCGYTEKDRNVQESNEILSIAECEMAALYMREHGWQLDRFWQKSEAVK